MSTFDLDDYIVDKKRIGKGSFSIVYKGENRYTKKLYAIKEISVDNVSKIKDNIKREVNLMKNLDHENIVKLHNVIIDKKYDNIYLVFDYYPLGDLAKFLNKRCLKEIYAQNYIRQLSKGLKYLYENSIIHRDLKPQNILVTETYNIKITDFGFARYFDSDIMIQTMCGSPIYMAPEIMKHKKYNNKSDLWSVGIIMYEMLTGHPPFRAKNILELLRKIKTQKLELPKNIKLSKKGTDLLLNLLNTNPDKRISWDNFFNHIWLIEDHITNNENNFLDIDSFMNENSNSLPNVDDLKLSSLFYNFNYNSISETNKNKPQSVEEDNVQEKNSDSREHSFNNNLHIENGCESDSDDSESSYLSASDNNTYSEQETVNKNNEYVKSDPIPINNNNNSKYVYVTKDMLSSNRPNNNHMFNSVMKQDYVVVASNSPEYINSDPVGVSPSLKEVLNTSLTIIKASYEYISNKSI
jgi:serine/threonine protein kinase